MRLIALLSSLLLPALLPLPAAAADGDKPSRYDIEVLVFENRLPELAGDELVGRDPAALRKKALENAALPAPGAGESYLQPGVAKLLEADGHYRVLAHAHWQQTLEPNPKTPVKPVRIAAADPNELDGSVRFIMSRFLHLDVTLLFQPAPADNTAPMTYTINEQRRIKSQETHYFDHPRFGVLVRVLPLDVPERR